MTCEQCTCGRESGATMIYCRFYGIFIRKDYAGCRHPGGQHEQVRKPEGRDERRDL